MTLKKTDIFTGMYEYINNASLKQHNSVKTHGSAALSRYKQCSVWVKHLSLQLQCTFNNNFSINFRCLYARSASSTLEKGVCFFYINLDVNRWIYHKSTKFMVNKLGVKFYYIPYCVYPCSSECVPADCLIHIPSCTFCSIYHT